MIGSGGNRRSFNGFFSTLMSCGDNFTDHRLLRLRPFISSWCNHFHCKNGTKALPHLILIAFIHGSQAISTRDKSETVQINSKPFTKLKRFSGK